MRFQGNQQGISKINAHSKKQSYHIVDFGLDEVQQGADTALSGLLERKRTDAQSHL